MTLPDANACERYLYARGWRLHPASDGRLCIYVKDDAQDDRGAPVPLHLPTRRGLRDEGRFVAKVIELLAALEGRPESEVAQDIAAGSPRTNNPRMRRRARATLRLERRWE